MGCCLESCFGHGMASRKDQKRALQKDPQLRSVDYQRLVLRAQEDPQAAWDDLVDASAPIVYTAALRLADDLRNGPSVAEEATLEVVHRLADDVIQPEHVAEVGQRLQVGEEQDHGKGA